MFTGTFTAIVTPFKSGKLDEEALRSLLRKQIDAGVDGIVPVGTTGESPTLNCEEHLRVIELAVESAAGKVKILAGTGGNATEEAIYLTREAKKRGADGSLQVAPYYNKPSQEGLYQHFKAIAEAVDLPIILYSIPGRCGVAIDIGTVKRLSDSCSNVIGIKEAGGDADRVSQLRYALGNDFTILSGDDGLTLPFMSVGAQGVISVASNIIPGPIASMVRDFAGGRTSDALATHAKYYDLFKALFIETNPVPVKEALYLMGLIGQEMRLPLVPMSDANRDKLKAVLAAHGLI
ncbi:MAG: 4-hydroxy-tetrahydrodipicolinate synthase [Verrucomicrobiota bacterium]|jgi:4-hydroxy-tetrahydrodipicolinate synthase